MMDMLIIFFPSITVAEEEYAAALLKEIEATRARELWRMMLEALPAQRMN